MSSRSPRSKGAIPADTQGFQPWVRTGVSIAVLAAFLLAPGTSSSSPNEPKTLSSRSLPWYRGDEHSRLRLRYDFGPAGLILKGPGRHGRVAELKFEIRF